MPAARPRPLLLPLVVPCLLACAALTTAPAADPSDSSPGSTPERSAATGEDRPALQAAMDAGMEAMRAADADPHRAVDAAIAFSRALAIAQHLGETDTVCELQADIFWCKKRMNLDQIQDYLAHKDSAAQQAFSTAKTVMETTVPVEEAGAYLNRANAFREAHPDDHFQIAIQFSEIVERFPGTPEATTAASTFATEQAQYLTQVAKERSQEHEQLQEALTQARQTRFMLPPAVITGTRVAVPEATVLAQARSEVHRVYKQALGRARTPGQERALARRLLEDAEKSHDDAAAYHEMLVEARRLALQAEDYALVLTTCDRQAAAFQGPDAKALAAEALKAASSHATASAILTLYAHPKDAEANLAVGKWYCYRLNQWDEGIDLLRYGADPALAKAAGMEQAGPQNAEEQKTLGDAWYDIGHHAGASADRIGAWTRADHWYTTCVGAVSGITQSLVKRRIEEIERQLPVVITDWSNLTASQWQRLHAPVVVVSARTDRSDSSRTVTADTPVRVVPCPSDTWDWSDGMGHTFTCGAAGGTPPFSPPRRGGRRGSAYVADNAGDVEGALGMQINDELIETAGIVRKPGHLWLVPINPWGLSGDGEIRVKLVPITDE